MKLYGLKTCDTCRKALRLLKESGREVTIVDLREEPLTQDRIERFLAAFGEDLVNRRSTTWRGLSEADRAETPQRLLLAHPALMKRPVIEEGETLHLGWTAEVQSRFT